MIGLFLLVLAVIAAPFVLVLLLWAIYFMIVYVICGLIAAPLIAELPSFRHLR